MTILIITAKDITHSRERIIHIAEEMSDVAGEYSIEDVYLELEDKAGLMHLEPAVGKPHDPNLR